jgi:hypothetical protein
MKVFRPLLLLLLTTSAMAQFTPSPIGAYISPSNGVWSPWTSVEAFGQIPFIPPAFGLYCQASAGAQWAPCNPGSGGSFITSLTTTGTSGPATVVSGVLNIPQYSGGGTCGSGNIPCTNTTNTFTAAQTITDTSASSPDTLALTNSSTSNVASLGLTSAGGDHYELQGGGTDFAAGWFYITDNTTSGIQVAWKGTIETLQSAGGYCWTNSTNPAAAPATGFMQASGSQVNLGNCSTNNTGGLLNLATLHATTAVTSSSYNQNSASNTGGTCSMSTSTSCTITISHTYTTPVCIATVQSATLTGSATGCTVSGTTVTINAAVANSLTWGAFVFGNPN